MTAPVRRGTRTVGIVNLADASGNPYLDQLVASLADLGVAAIPVRLTPQDVVRSWRGGVRAFHVHWPEYLVFRGRTGRIASVRYAAVFARLVFTVLLARLLGVRLVWTVHNLGPHEPDAPWTSRWAYPLLARGAQVFITHSRDAARRAADRYPRIAGREIVAPHGNYSGMYGAPSAGARAAVRARFGIPADAVLLIAFGQVRGYKRLAELSRLVVATGDLSLLVAGSPVDEPHAEQVRAVASQSDRVHVDLRRIPDEEVADLYAASDLAVMHYSEVFSSGALLLALSEGVAAVTPRSAAAGEVAGPPALVMYEADELGHAVRSAMQTPEPQRRAAALEAAASASWANAAAAHERAYFG